MNKKHIIKAVFKSMFRTTKDDRMKLIKSRIPLYNKDQVSYGINTAISKTAQTISDDIKKIEYKNLTKNFELNGKQCEAIHLFRREIEKKLKTKWSVK